jgi:integrase
MTHPITLHQDEAQSITTINHNIDPRSIELIRAGKSQRTRELYVENFNRFQDWANENRFPSIPASSKAIEQYLHHLIGQEYKVSTIELALQSIKAIHEAVGQTFSAVPFLKEMMRGLKKTKGTKKRQAKPLTIDLIARGLSKENTVIAKRDRALVLVAFAGALRRSEICELTIGDVDFKEEGVVLTIQQSKTDQEGEGRQIPIHRSHDENNWMCPVKAMKEWLDIVKGDSTQPTEPLFRSIKKGGHVQGAITDGSISRLVKKVAKTAGEDVAGYSGHSLRSGYVTEAARRGAQSHQIMMVTGHKSDAMVRTYIRSGRLFMDTVSLL